jgi:putative colanic acid biosynthesis UDP-glucose lipid carrier transferase
MPPPGPAPAQRPRKGAPAGRSILKSHATLLETLVRVADPLLVIASGAIAYYLYFDSWQLPESYWLVLLGVAVLCVAVFPLSRLYAPQRGVTFFVELRQLAYAWALVGACIAGIFFATKSGAEFSRAWIGIWLALGFLTHLMARVALRVLLRWLRRRGMNLRHVAVVGAGPLGQDIVQRLRGAPWSGFAVRGFYDDDPGLAGQRFHDVPVLGTPADLVTNIEELELDQVWIALPLREEARIHELLTDLQRVSVQISFVPDIHGFHLINHSVTEVAGMPVINLTETPLTGVSLVIKAVEDFVLSVLLLVLASPLLLLLAIGVKLDSPGPIFYRQQRLTWNGTRFEMLKFRSMPMGSEMASGAVWAKPGDVRATRFGAFIRRWSLDELPQLFNVLRGDMSLVGPRPERPEFVERFRAEIPGYMQKHLVKAGITGWAQINDLRGDTDLRKRIEYDLFYIENWSIWFDVRILALTLIRVVQSRNAY